MFRWYLIHTKPSGEMAAEDNLERQGYEVYLPRLAQPGQHHGRWRERVAALFPRYLFLRLNEGHQALGPVRSTVGVANVVRFGSDYAVVQERVISALRAREDPISGLHQLNRPRLLRGMAVTVAQGPFSGLEGVFEREAGTKRVLVLLNLLGRETSVSVSPDFILPSHAL